MASRSRVPRLTNPDIIIRLAENQQEIEAANELIYQSYVNLYWADDPAAFRANKYLATPARRVFVAVDHDRIVGTMSIIKDSPLGLPSDTFHPSHLCGYRDLAERIAEVTSFAVAQSIQHPMNLILFLIKFLMQYSFYYEGLDRLIASCRAKHADFYEERLCFTKLTQPMPYAYAGNVECQLVTLDLTEAHLLLSHRYETADESGSNFYRFLFVDDHPNVRLPDKHHLRRSPQLNWVALASERGMSIAV